MQRTYTYLYQLFQNIEEEGTLPKAFYESNIILISKPDSDTTKKKLQANIFDEYTCKNPQQSISKMNPAVHKDDHTP